MAVIEIIYSLTLLIIMGVILSAEISSRTAGIPPVPTLPKTRRRIMAALQTHLKDVQPSNIAELGSGWGGLSVALSRIFPDAAITGYEISPAPYWFSKLRCFGRNIHFLRHNFYEADFSAFDVVVCYLSPQHMKKLKSKLEKELPDGALIISNSFSIPDWKPLEEIRISNWGYKTTIYIYRQR